MAATLHAIVPNLYSMLGHVPASAAWLTCLDIKHAFIYIQLATVSWDVFASEWAPSQYTWTRLPRGFKNSSTIFEDLLASDLKSFRPPSNQCVLQPYIDYLLLASPTRNECIQRTKSLLQVLWESGYKISRKRHRSVAKEFSVLDFISPKGGVSLGNSKNKLPVAFLSQTQSGKPWSF